ncbi:hypothetical protein CFHF_09625 [Caulobacter flavus]|jgi:hypothetical protein|uniref:Thioredoxin-like fold domain-containing protein n=1 Tax=Caulobacter flavus TaxID=1679497 RepID=A0A2N5CV59_9CAUL|nr:hypothetical protein [Caulobacter flavus]AYV45458.1 hypothetical protein C1707_03910 [Caulobacter flavus]PLR17690.1 hypothetical protein CFHF_09625 [Caulobacter flavus]
MKNWKLWAGLAAVVVVVVAGWGAWWNFELRWRPKTITKNQAEIAKILEGSGWVSPGLKGPKLYMISFRTCPDCVRFKKEEYPRLHKAGVDTRLIEIARADRNGVPKSTPVERATVAELWINRSWELSEAWDATPVDAWTAPGLKPADGDIARTAVIEAGRKSVEDLVPLLKANGVNFAYPLLVWWTPDGQMKACACEKRETYRFVRKDLGL